MQIDSIELIRVVMPLTYPFRVAFGDISAQESVLVRLSSGPFHGWGEAASGKYPAYCPESASTQFLIGREFIGPLLLGQEINSGEELQARLSGIRGNHFAKAGFDLAWWDLHARMLGKPLWQVLGGRGPVIDVGADLGVLESIEQLLDEIRAAIDHGYKRFKLKYRPGWDLFMVQAVREAFPDIIMHVDCNSAYTLNDLEMLKELDRFNMAMIEQPLMHDDLIDHATLQAEIQTPICLDESIISAEKARKAIQIKACGWINIKPGRVGGITNSLAVHNLCQEEGVPCWIGGMLESAIGASHCLALATLPNIRYPSDIFPTSRFYKEDLGTPSMRHSAPSQFQASPEPGIGVEPNPDTLERFVLERVVLKA